MITLLAGLTMTLAISYGLIIILFVISLRFPHHPEQTQKPQVSVIIAARNEEHNIGALLQDMIEQDYPVERFEVIIANDNSSDATAAIVNGYVGKFPFIKLINITDTPAGFSPKKYALQCAVDRAGGEIILATDADCRVGPRWISTMASYFSDQVGFVIGFSQFGRPGQAQKFVERFQAFDFVTLMGVAAAATHLGVPMAASGQNLGYRKSAFNAVNGYHSIRQRLSGDDVLLMQMIRKHTDGRIVYASHPDSFAVSAPQPSWSSFINQRNRWASNGGYQIRLNLTFFCYLILTFSFNMLLFIGYPWALYLHQHTMLFSCCLAGKACGEGLIALAAADFFNRKDLLNCFPSWFMLQIPYVVVVGVLGSLGLFRWKGRNGRVQNRSNNKRTGPNG
jgi:poly-beta-1,6-N-acetyl-D-glucosamine synthase